MLLAMPEKGDILRRLLDEQGRTPSWLASKMGIRSKQSIYDYLSGKSVPRDNAFWERAATFLKVNPRVFADSGTPHERPNVSLEQRSELRQQINLVPYWGTVPCGDWDMPTSDPGYIQVSDRIADIQGVIAVRVSGPSLEPRLHDGQLVSVKLSDRMLDGVLTLYRNGDGEFTMKVMRKTPTGWMLHSPNPDYSDIRAEEVQVIGYAINVEEYDQYGLRL